MTLAVGSIAPPFTLEDQFGRKVAVRDLLQTRNVMLVAYPLDWTPN